MILILLSWLWIALVTLGLGKFICDKVSAFSGVKSIGLEWLMLLGICFLSWILAWVSIIIKIGFPVQVVVTALSGSYLFIHFKSVTALIINYFKSYSGSLAAGLLILLFGSLTLVHAAQVPAFYDSGIYHIQFIKWIQNFAVVPGLGNLHGRLAFNSHVHLLCAFFSPADNGSFAFAQNFSSFLFFLFSIYFVRQLFKYLGQNDARVIFYAGALVLVFISYRPTISSPMPDSSITLLALMVLSLILEKFKERITTGIDVSLILLVVVFFTAITFKVSAVYLSLLLFYLLFILKPANRLKFIKKWASWVD